MEGNIARILGGPWSPKEPDSPEVQLRVAMAQLDLDPPSIVLDGQLHRFAVGNSKDAGWYVAYGDGVPAGMFGNWKTGEAITFRADVGRKLTAAEEMAHARRVAELRKKREEDTERKHENAAEVANKIWTNAGIADSNHPYLQRKGVKAHILRITGDGRLIAPMYDADGNISSLQYISSDGAKSFHPGGAVRGCYAVLGEPAQDIYIAEGFATGATIYEAIHKPVIITYSAGNIPPVTETIRAKFPTASITIVADNDASGVGQNYAEQAAAKYGARVVVSPVTSDVNDFVQGGGDLASLLETKSENKPWLIPADEYDKEPKPIDWLVKHWLQQHGTAMIHGASGSGKSFVALDWSMRIASTLETWGDEKLNHGTVIYLAGEGHQGLHARVAAWKQHNEEKKLDMYISSGGLDLDKPEGLYKTITEIRSTGVVPVLIVVDTLHRFNSGNERDEADVRKMLQSCSLLTDEFGATVMFVHHTGVNPEAQDRGRGSGSWKAALDNEFSVKQKDGKVCISQKKMKDTEERPDVWLEMKQIAVNGWYDEDGEPVTSVVLEPSDAPKRKRSAQESKDRRLIENAWRYAGCKFENNYPFVSNADCKNFLMEEHGKTKTAAVQAMKVSAGGLAFRLFEYGLISDYGNGFIIIDEELSNGLRVGTNGTK